MVVIRFDPLATPRTNSSCSIDAEHVEARYHNEVLPLTIPVAEQAKARKVAITTTRRRPRWQRR